MIALTDAAVQHREQFRDFVLLKAEPWHRHHLGKLYELWNEWNRDFFGGALVAPYVLLSEPSAPSRYGDCSSVSGFGGRSQIRLRPSLLTGTHPHMRPGAEFAEGRFRFTADVLLHETNHQHGQEVSGRTEEAYHGHGPAFRDNCNRLGAVLGLPSVRHAKARGKDRDLPSCAQWPHNVRPADYYLDAIRPPEEETIMPKQCSCRVHVVFSRTVRTAAFESARVEFGLDLEGLDSERDALAQSAKAWCEEQIVAALAVRSEPENSNGAKSNGATSPSAEPVHPF